MAKKKHIPLFDDQLEMMELLTDRELGQAVLSAMRFMRDGTETALSGAAGVVYQALRAQFVRNQNDAETGKKGGRPRKNRAETPVSAAETTEQDGTEPDGTKQDGTEQNGTEPEGTEGKETEGEGAEDGSAGGRFVPPTLEQVRAYVSQRRSRVDPQTFLDFYQARGWMVGKAPMRDWRAACRNAESWERWDRPAAPPRTGDPDRMGKYIR